MPLRRKRGYYQLILALFGCSVILLVLQTRAAQPKRVLIVHSFGNAAPPFTTHSIAFETELTAKMGEPVDLDEVSLDVARYASLDMEAALVEFIQARQAKWQPDLVVPIGSPAGIFVAQHRERLFPPSTPIVYTGMDKRRLPPGALDQNATFVGESFDLRGWVEDILQIAPDTKNIAVVIGDSPLERVWTDVLKKEYEAFADRLNFIWLNDLSVEGILQRTKNLPPHSFILHVLMLRDASGVTHDGDKVLEQIHAVANAPINGIYQNELGLGITGGRLYQGEAEGVEAARIAVRILHGEPASHFEPKIVGALPPRYDWRELKKWNIDEKLLPRGSTVLYRTPTLWQSYRGWIVGSAAVILVQTMLIAALIANLLRRRRAERSLSASEARTALAAEAARLGVWELDIATGRMWVSEKAREIFDLEAGATVDLVTLGKLVHPEDRAARSAAIEGAILGLREYEIEYRIVLSTGTVRWLSGRGRRMNDAHGRPTRLLGVSMDITDRKEAVSARERAEEEAQRQREQIDVLGRASLLGKMTASLAHELGQPLAAIIANAGAGVRFIDAGEVVPEALREIFSDVAADGLRARDVIQSVRNSVKKGHSVRGRVDISSVVKKVLLMVRLDAAVYSCRVETSLAEGLPLVDADPIQMQQVLINLVTNAFHAMSETPVDLPLVEITTGLDGDAAVRVTVRDHGAGISKEAQARLFEQFYTTKKDGLGMGLAIVRSIIEAHGGEITVRNAEGGGACFEFHLPTAAHSQE
ncbi:MAG TPA: ATP-binding protein [Chthoniobacteraceae bacterium]|jgi:PAS domain S-box-containing protein